MLTYRKPLLGRWLPRRWAPHRGLSDRCQCAAAAAQAREQERLRHARLLHDRVLQTLEALARDGSALDGRLRAHVAAEACWLRGLVNGAHTQPGDLVARLQELVERSAGVGLRVQLHDQQLRARRGALAAVPPAVLDALVGAAGEALTNAGKHSGVASAVLRGTVADGMLTLSVLDRGVGFDPRRVAARFGLPASIQARLAEVGGQAVLDSAPGAGTYIELRVPLAGAA